MGKRIISRRRGAGSNVYKSPGHRFKGSSSHVGLEEFMKGGLMQVVDIINDPSNTAPVMVLLTEAFEKCLQFAPVGVKVGDLLAFGPEAEATVGNTLSVSKIPEGTQIYNIELVPGDGGKLVKSSGTSAYIVSHDYERQVTVIQLPSKKKRDVPFACRATIGILAGSGRKEKPYIKAGTRFKDRKAKGKLYPRTSAVAMNAIDHPFGGSTRPGRATSAKKNAPPGQKVGNLAPRRTGVRRTKKVA